MFVVLSVILALLGFVLSGGGVWLATLGGSSYYLLVGVGFLIVARLLYRGRAEVYHTYALLVFGSLVWAIYEVGFDWWALAPRGGLIVLLGALLLGSWWQARRKHDDDPVAWRSGGGLLVASLAITIVTATYAICIDTHDVSGEVPATPYSLSPSEAAVEAGEWIAYGRTPGGSHYSPLVAITTQNVAKLQKAWEYRTGDRRSNEDPEETTYEVTPLMVDNVLYLCTPHHLAIALDPVSGKEIWRFDPGAGLNKQRQHQTCRGLSYYRVRGAPVDESCSARVLLPTGDARLIALDALKGTPCLAFGDQGTVDLWANMPNVYAGSYYSTSPPVIGGGLVVVGGAVNDNVSTTEPSGVIRAYDEVTGRLVWNFDSGNPEKTQPITEGGTYVGNSPNAWSILSLDEDLGLVFAPMGNAPPDQYGADRTSETERFSSSVVALDLRTGELRWVRQLIHHDLWDMDTPSQPQLIDLPRQEGTLPALVQATKQGDIYVLDRRTGEPVLPVSEEPVPAGAVEGDWTAPTQPSSAMTFKPKPLREQDMWGATMLDQLYCRILFRSLKYEGRYTPPSTSGTIVYPGNFGTFNWGGVAVDPARRVVIANPVYLAFIVRLIPRGDDTTSYVSEEKPGFNENFGAPFAAMMQPFWSPLGLPCQAPPWGYIAAADLRTGHVIWQHRNGTVRDLSPLPLPFKMGVPGIGGPITTAGGVAFYSGALDNYVRAFDVTDGSELWRERLPAGGQATPMTYEGKDGRQYVVVVAGGHGSTGTTAGDSIIAYALPKV